MFELNIEVKIPIYWATVSFCLFRKFVLTFHASLQRWHEYKWNEYFHVVQIRQNWNINQLG